MTTTSQAPALERGIKVLNLLSREGELSLENITNCTRIPKASLLRFLDTLMTQGCVKRDPKTKKFSALMTLNPVQGKMDDFSITKREMMNQLSSDHQVTAEWFELNEDSMELTERVEPETEIINVTARVGYKKSLTKDVSAVSKVALSYLLNETNTKIIFDDPKIELLDSIKDVEKNNYYAEDTDYNQEGFKRIAKVITSNEGDLVGVLSLAINSTPQNDVDLKAIERRLKLTCKDLESKYKHMRLVS